MKQLLSSVFVGLILLNVMGYYGVFLGLQYKNARDMRLQFDAGTYDKTLTRIVKIPFDGPDSLSSETFQRMDADFEKDGEIYRVIKKRLYRDTFHIVYIKDERGTAIQQTLAKVARTFAAQTADDAQDHKTIVPSFIKEYLFKAFTGQQVSTGWEEVIRKGNRLPVFIGTFTPAIVHPPERA